MQELLASVILGLIFAGLFIWRDKGNERSDRMKAQIRDLEYRSKQLDKQLGE